ncbi:glycosyltransferase family 2 protein [Methylotuvimicrobium sp. KM1]|uniref:glycosyltransferase family 2 protein n=1 Tax=Methylotuvimicrobium sp. KM1 TaxID=3377707 RepID=UPI00384F43E7
MEPVDLLLITWNRREYLVKTLDNLLADDTDFRLYCWDNASEDGVADIINSLNDPRVAKKNFSKENVKQRTPTLWFFENAKSDVVGKIDDDILLPHGWVDVIAPIIRQNEQFGRLSCWNYMQEDWNEQLAAHKIININGVRVFRNMWVGGASFLARLDHLTPFIKPENEGYGFPIDQYRMSSSGLINGYPLPMLFAHHMDDPRSEHCLMAKNGVVGSQDSVTARYFGFTDPFEYGRWIAEDARNTLRDPVSLQIKRERLRRDQTLIGKIKRKLNRLL